MALAVTPPRIDGNCKDSAQYGDGPKVFQGAWQIVAIKTVQPVYIFPAAQPGELAFGILAGSRLCEGACLLQIAVSAQIGDQFGRANRLCPERGGVPEGQHRARLVNRAARQHEIEPSINPRGEPIALGIQHERGAVGLGQERRRGLILPMGEAQPRGAQHLPSALHPGAVLPINPRPRRRIERLLVIDLAGRLVRLADQAFEGLAGLGAGALAEEFFQDTWQRVITARERYRPEAKFATWLYQIAHNRVTDHWRAKQHRPDAPGDATELAERAARYAALEWLSRPVWVFDIDHKRVHWANTAALSVWQAASVQALCVRDMGRDMSGSVAQRLAQSGERVGVDARIVEIVDLAFEHRLEPGNRPQCGGLAAARRTEQAADIAGIEVQIEVLHHLMSGVAAAQVT